MTFAVASLPEQLSELEARPAMVGEALELLAIELLGLARALYAAPTLSNPLLPRPAQARGFLVRASYVPLRPPVLRKSRISPIRIVLSAALTMS